MGLNNAALTRGSDGEAMGKCEGRGTGQWEQQVQMLRGTLTLSMFGEQQGGSCT